MKPLILAAIFLVASCSSNQEIACRPATGEVVSIKFSELPNYFKVSGYRKVKVAPKVERAIKKGSFGYVVFDQTISKEGVVTSLKVIDSYPDDFFVQTGIDLVKGDKYYVDNGCSPISVRFRNPVKFTNGKNIRKVKQLLSERGHEL